MPDEAVAVKWGASCTGCYFSRWARHGRKHRYISEDSGEVFLALQSLSKDQHECN